jgi:methylated-DNA-[protein]-cysteine S-methyltransferase
MSEHENFFFDRIDSPIGGIVLVADARGTLRMMSFDEGDERWRADFQRRFRGAVLAERENPFGLSATLREYFGGDMEALGRIPVAFTGTAFQNKVWNALCRIPVGTTVSYGALAREIGEPKAVRAVGLANGSNPIGIVVPCHRVIGSDGSLTGYGGGLPRKRWLLDHEARHCATKFRLEASA